MSNKDNTNNNGDSSTNFKLDIDKNLSVGTVLSRYYSNRNKHYLYGFVSFLMTAAFYVVFISPGIEQVFTDAFDLKVSAWVWAFIGLLFSVVITILIMHSHTTDRPQSKYVAYGMVIVLGVAFNLFTEVSSTSDRVQERVTIKSENSALFKALTEKAKHSTGQANTSLTKARNDYADAVSTAKARCKKGSSYNKRLCTKWTMRADEYKTAMELHKDGATTELQETVNLAKEASHNTEYAQMTIQLVMEQLGVSFRIATMLVSLFIIFTFETLGATIGYDYRRYRDALPYYGIDLHADKEAKAESKKLDSEIKQLEAETMADEKRMDAEIKQMEVDLKRYQKEVEHQAKADKMRQQLAKFKESLSMQTSPSAGSAKVSSDDNHNPPIPEEIEDHPSFDPAHKRDYYFLKSRGISDADILIQWTSAMESRKKRKPLSDAEKEKLKKEAEEMGLAPMNLNNTCRTCGIQNSTVGANGFCSAECESKSTSPLPTLDRQNELDLSSKTTTSKKYDVVKNKPDLAEKSDVVKDHEKQHLTTTPLTASKKGDYPRVVSESDVVKEKDHFSDTDLIFSAWKKAVISSGISLADEPSKMWVKKHLGQHTSRQVKKVTGRYSETISNLLRARGVSDGIIKLNPEYRKGNRKLKYILV